MQISLVSLHTALPLLDAFYQEQGILVALSMSMEGEAGPPVSTALEGPLKSNVQESRLANMLCVHPVCSYLQKI